MAKKTENQTVIVQFEITEFEWDERKRLKNIEKHGIDFRKAARVFDGPVLVQRSDHRDEVRWIATGQMNERFISVVYTQRNKVCRIISARPARHQERTAYSAIHT